MRLTLLSTLLFPAFGFELHDEIGLMQHHLIHGGSKLDCKSGKCKKKSTTTITPVTGGKIGTTSTTTTPFDGEMKSCLVWGDPQVTTFDGIISARFFFDGTFYDDSQIDTYKSGDYYLAKADNIEVQGRFSAGAGTFRSMMRELAITGTALDGMLLVVRPHAITLDGKEIDLVGGAGQSGSVTVKQDHDGLLIEFSNDDSVDVWVQQTLNAVNAKIYMMPMPGLTGLCGNNDGDQENDKSMMLKDSMKVSGESSIFPGPPIDFMGCAVEADRQLIGWPLKGPVENADLCAIQCKMGAKSYPDFYLTKSLHSHSAQVNCHCGSIAENNNAWNYAHIGKKENLHNLPSSRGSCNEEACMKSFPILGDELCFFREKAKVEPKICSAKTKQDAKAKCEESMPSAMEACIIELCNTERSDWDIILSEDQTFAINSKKVDDDISKRPKQKGRR